MRFISTAMIYDSDAPAASTNAGRETGREITNCELSDRDTRELDLQNPTMFDTSSFDYYERSNGRSGSDTDCLDGESADPIAITQTEHHTICIRLQFDFFVLFPSVRLLF